MKNSKKGISLIVLVITIIVIIILAAAVIISLQRNNPITEANDARYRSDLANMQAVFTNAVAKVMAANQEIVTMKEGVTITNGSVPYYLGEVSSDDTRPADGNIIFGIKPADARPNDWYTGKALPTYNDTATWSIDASGNLSLKLSTRSLPYTIN